MEPTFVHLHNHSEYSVLDGCLKIESLVQSAYENNMPAVAMTDHGNVFGAVQFFKAAKAKGIKPILGCECYVAPQSRFDKKPGPSDEVHHFHLILLVKDDRGYKNLCQLLTKAYLEGFYYRPRIDKELLAVHSEGLIGLSACLKGELAGTGAQRHTSVRGPSAPEGTRWRDARSGERCTCSASTSQNRSSSVAPRQRPSRRLSTATGITTPDAPAHSPAPEGAWRLVH